MKQSDTTVPTAPAPPSPLTPERIGELRRLLVAAEDSDAALENLLTEDEETIVLAGSDADDAEDALRDALRGSAPALLLAAERLAEVEARYERLRKDHILIGERGPRGTLSRCRLCDHAWHGPHTGEREHHSPDCPAAPEVPRG